MSSVAQQIRCPSCGGAQEVRESERYECRFCLTPFTYRHAQEVEDRQIAEIKAWVEQRIGGQGAAGDGGIDASSRAYLFRKNLLPSLQTAHDRALRRGRHSALLHHAESTGDSSETRSPRPTPASS